MPLRGLDVARHPVRRVETRADHELEAGSNPASVPAVDWRRHLAEPWAHLRHLQDD